MRFKELKHKYKHAIVADEHVGNATLIIKINVGQPGMWLNTTQ